MASTSIEEQAVEAAVIRKQYHGGTTCLRCGGLMMSEPYYESIMRRCIQCGERVDAVILENRQNHGRIRAGDLLTARSSTYCA
jgi:hypothetical protein